ncbi:unnamed protein product [Peniophora sp. CBMAI 1063]|nr:unnamed protein product [Peniophora sp. CBMAI 1063]
MAPSPNAMANRHEYYMPDKERHFAPHEGLFSVADGVGDGDEGSLESVAVAAACEGKAGGVQSGAKNDIAVDAEGTSCARFTAIELKAKKVLTDDSSSPLCEECAVLQTEMKTEGARHRSVSECQPEVFAAMDFVLDMQFRAKRKRDEDVNGDASDDDMPGLE